MSNLEAALAYARSGIYVGPAKHNTKHPGSILGQGWESKTSRGVIKIKQWFKDHPDAEVFLHVGKSGLILFDLDVDDLDAVPGLYRSKLRTAMVQRSRKTGDRGHYLYRTRRGESFSNSPGGFAGFGEVRGRNGVIMAEPSNHVNGGRYHWPKPGRIPLLPSELRQLLKEAAHHAPAMPSEELTDFLDSYANSDRENILKNVVGQFEQRVSDGHSRHHTMVEAMPWAFREAVAGCYPARRAYEELEAAWEQSFKGPDAAARGRTSPLRGEFAGIAAWAAAQALAADPAETLARIDRKVDDAEFWTARPFLRDLRTFAQARRVSPWAMFGAVAARAVAAVPPLAVLPKLVGSQASLNLFVALVGPSGAGKGAAEQAANDFIDTDPPVEVATVGSGEGIAKLFAHKVKGDQINERNAVLFTVPEIDNLTALGNRQGATLVPQLRTAWSGERLGFAYADPSKAVRIERHRYRLNLVLGVQPERAGPLMDDSDGGTPQRFLWFPTTDPDAPDVPPEEPARWALPAWPRDPNDAPAMDKEMLPIPVTPGELVEIGVPDDAVQFVDAVRLSNLRGVGNGVKLEGHAALARLKVAAALMLLDGRFDKVDDEDWRLAGVVCEVSAYTRNRIQSALGEKAAHENAKRGRAEGARTVAAAEVTEEATAKRLAANIRKHLERNSPQTRRDLRKRARPVDRDEVDGALDRLIEAGVVEIVPGTYERYQLS